MKNTFKENNSKCTSCQAMLERGLSDPLHSPTGLSCTMDQAGECGTQAILYWYYWGILYHMGVPFASLSLGWLVFSTVNVKLLNLPRSINRSFLFFHFLWFKLLTVKPSLRILNRKLLKSTIQVLQTVRCSEWPDGLWCHPAHPLPVT